MIVDIGGKLYNCEANYQKNGGQYGHIDTLATAKPKNATKMLKIFRVTSGLSQDGAVGSECFDGFELLSKEEAMEILKNGKDKDDIFYSVYTYCCLMYFVSDLWR